MAKCQQATLKAAGAERVFAEKISGVAAERRQLAKAIAAIMPVACSWFTPARSARQINPGPPECFNEHIGEGCGVPIARRCHDRQRIPHGKLIVAVLGALAEFERSMILARTADGRAMAQARGVRFGRKPKLTAHQIQEALARKAAGVALAGIGGSYNVSHSTISRLGGNG
jgi:hypothetical protein